MWESVKHFFWQTRGVWITTPSVAGLVILLRLAGVLQAWEGELYDWYMRSRPPEPTDERIAIVGIDEADVQNLGQSIIPDNTLAELLEKIKAQQPRAIGLDIYRDLPVPPGTEQLNTVFETTANLVGVQKVAGEIGRETVAPPPILQEKGQVGANDLIFDGNNRVRRGVIYLDNEDGTVYSFSLHLALHYLEAEGITVEPDAENPDVWRLGKAVFHPLEPNEGGYVRTDAGGYQFLINYRGGDRTFETVSMTDVMTGKIPPDWGRDRIILIGKVGESFKDLFFIPYSSGLFELPEPVAGVEIHANLVSQIISAALENRPLIKTWSDPLENLWIVFWAGIGALLIWQLRYADEGKLGSPKRWGSLIIAGATLIGTTYVAFLGGWWLPIVPPLLAMSGAAIAITAYVARTAVEIRKTFGRYLTDQVVATLLEDPSGQDLGGIRKKITILTSDLRGFTATAERLPPEEVIKILNFYLGYMADVITKYQGTIDEFMGDGILVLFGAPTSQPDEAQRAIACAIEMQLVMKQVNQQMTEWGLPKLDMGIGINTGEVVVGNIGSEKRTKYGVVGSQVNLTYRIESYTTGGQILISETTLTEAGEGIIVNNTKKVQPKGVPHPITIYEIGGIQGKYNLMLEKEAEIYVPLNPAIALRYRLLEGKNVGETLFKGHLTQLSAKGGQIVLNGESNASSPPSLTNLKINFLNFAGENPESEDIYGKVLEKKSDNGSFYVQFTAKPPLIATKLDNLYDNLSSG